jgi:hypothetical protein
MKTEKQKTSSKGRREIIMVITESPNFLIPAFELQAMYAGWSPDQIGQVVSLLRTKTFDEQKDYLMSTWIKPWEDHKYLHQVDVQYMLNQVGLCEHYLFSKDMKEWSSYDWSLLLLLTTEFLNAHIFVWVMYPLNTFISEKYMVMPVHPQIFRKKEQAEDFLEKEARKDHHFSCMQRWIEVTQ